MEWALFILFVAAVTLLILSFMQTRKSAKEQQTVEHVSMSFMDEAFKLQQQIRNLELDIEILAQEAGVMGGSTEKRLLLREVLDLYKRGYSFESIATKAELKKEEVETMLSPYIKSNDERGKASNESSNNN